MDIREKFAGCFHAILHGLVSCLNKPRNISLASVQSGTDTFGCKPCHTITASIRLQYGNEPSVPKSSAPASDIISARGMRPKIRASGRAKSERRYSMEYRLLGDSGLKVPALSFGTGTFGGGTEFFKAWGASDVAEATRLVDICLDAGVNFFDTADIYSDGLSETILGKAVAGRRDQVLISTKASFRM